MLQVVRQNRLLAQRRATAAARRLANVHAAATGGRSQARRAWVPGYGRQARRCLGGLTRAQAQPGLEHRRRRQQACAQRGQQARKVVWRRVLGRRLSLGIFCACSSTVKR